MLDLIRSDLAKLGVHHDLFSSEAEVQAPAPSIAPWHARCKGLIYQACSSRRKGKAADDWEPVELILFRSTSLATIRTGR
jgi:arginyl-tRNA synthetase